MNRELRIHPCYGGYGRYKISVKYRGKWISCVSTDSHSVDDYNTENDERDGRFLRKKRGFDLLRDECIKANFEHFYGKMLTKKQMGTNRVFEQPLRTLKELRGDPKRYMMLDVAFEGTCQLYRDTSNGMDYVVLADNSVITRYEDIMGKDPIFPYIQKPAK